MQFLIYGAGALGQAIGGMLAAAGHRVDLLLRERFISAIGQNGLHITGIFGDFFAPQENLGLYSTIDATSNRYDYALITTKTYDTATAVADMATITERIGSVVSMQNGCGNVEKIEEVFGPARSLGARVITGFEICSPGRVRITVSADAIHIGGSMPGTSPESAQRLATAIADSGHPCLAVDDIHQSLFAKLLYNCALNPLGALLGVHYGALTDNVHTREIVAKVIDETFDVIIGLGGHLPWSDAATYKDLFFNTLIPATSNHRPSMLQDLENNKPTEVEALVGYVGRQGRRLGIATPTCDVLAAMVRFREGQTADRRE